MKPVTIISYYLNNEIDITILPSHNTCQGTSASSSASASSSSSSSSSSGYSYSYGLMGLSKSIYQLPLLVLPHLRPLGTSVGGKLLGTGASCIVTAVLKPCGGCICATTSLRVCDLAQVYPRILATSASEVAAMWIPAQWAGMVCWSQNCVLF